jgi:BlaI family transcriptional regulator, penicillinase repressor
MSKAQKISDAEHTVMECLWRRGCATGREVVADLTVVTKWKPSTILTMLRRLKDKGVVGTDSSGREMRYTPLVTEDECREAAGTSFVERFFGGSLMPMLAHFTTSGKLTRKEREHLRRLLDESEKTNRKIPGK